MFPNSFIRDGMIFPSRLPPSSRTLLLLLVVVSLLPTDGASRTTVPTFLAVNDNNSPRRSRTNLGASSPPSPPREVGANNGPVVDGLFTGCCRPPPRVAVIGAGAAGLAVSRQIQKKIGNFSRLVVLERDDSPGGVWNYVAPEEEDPPATSRRPMYRGLRTNLPREIMAFREKPWGGDGIGKRCVCLCVRAPGSGVAFHISNLFVVVVGKASRFNISRLKDQVLLRGTGNDVKSRGDSDEQESFRVVDRLLGL